MIISLTIAIDQLTGLASELVEELLSEVIRCSRRGNHIVAIPRATCDWATQNFQFSGIDRAHLETIREDFTQTGGLARNPRFVALEIASEDEPLQQLSANRWSIGITHALQSRAFERPILILENATNDGQMFKSLT